MPQPPPGLARTLCTRFHLVDKLACLRLIAEGAPNSIVQIKLSGAGKMTLLKGDKAFEARRHVASHLTAQSITALQRPPDVANPDLRLMQELFDAGIGHCPSSGMPVFDPSACSAELRASIWRAYVGVASAVNTKSIGESVEALGALQTRLRDHCD